MNINPKLYDDTNSIQIELAMELINIIRKDDVQRLNFFPSKIVFKNPYLSSIDIALDIGCGSGNITRLLKENVNIDLLVGLDVDKLMVDFANIENSNDGLHFVCQDFGKELDEWQEIKELKGRVSLVFSNACLHWIKDVDVVVENIAKLCSSNARAYLLFLLDTDRGWPVFKTTFINRFFGIHNENQLKEIWSKKFEKAHFTIDLCKIFDAGKEIDEAHYETRKYLSEITIWKE